MKKLTIAFLSLALIIASSGFAATKKGGKEDAKKGPDAAKTDKAKAQQSQKAKAAEHKDAGAKSK